MGDKETPLRVGDSILDFVGHTPILRAQKLCPKGAAEVYIKLENFNPGGSIKTRVAHKMIINAEENGILTPNSNQVIIEPTGGNTGIGLAMVGAIRGYKVILVVPDNYSQHKIKYAKHMVPSDFVR